MCEGGTVFNDQHAFSADGTGVLDGQRGSGFDHGSSGVDGVQVGAHLDDRIGIGGIHLVDDKYIGHAGGCFTRVIFHLVARTVRIGNHDGQIGLVEGDVIVAAIPQDNIRFLFGLAQDGFVIHTGINNHAVVDMGFVFFSFLDGALILVQIGVLGVALNGLFGQITIGHGMPDGCHAEAHIDQDLCHAARGLALAATGTHSAHRDNLFGRFDGGIGSAHQHKIGAGCDHFGSLVHHHFMRLIAVSEHNLFNVVLADQVKQFAFIVDRNAFRVQVARQYSRIQTTFNIGYLGGSEGNHLVVLIAAKEDIEIMEISSCGAHDEGTNWGHSGHSLIVLEKGILVEGEPGVDRKRS